jgi:hypothetical protein
VAKLGPSLDIRGEISGIHVGDAGDERRTEERQDAPVPRRPAGTIEHCGSGCDRAVAFAQELRTFVNSGFRRNVVSIHSAEISRGVAESCRRIHGGGETVYPKLAARITYAPRIFTTTRLRRCPSNSA